MAAYYLYLFILSITKTFSEIVFYLYSLLLQQNYLVWAACPQNPRKHSVFPPRGRMETPGLLPGAKVLNRRNIM